MQLVYSGAHVSQGVREEAVFQKKQEKNLCYIAIIEAQ